MALQLEVHQKFSSIFKTAIKPQVGANLYVVPILTHFFVEALFPLRVGALCLNRYEKSAEKVSLCFKSSNFLLYHNISSIVQFTQTKQFYWPV